MTDLHSLRDFGRLTLFAIKIHPSITICYFLNDFELHPLEFSLIPWFK